MSLNINNDETCRLASDLAKLTGETMTGAITVALRKRDIANRTRKLRAIAERCATLMGPGPSAIEHGDLLYDDQGLPK